MAGARVNVPSTFVAGGPTLAGHVCDGDEVRTIDLSMLFEVIRSRFF